MRPTTDAEKFNALAGTVHALKLVCIALIEASPRREDALRRIGVLKERAIVSNLSEPIPDDALQACDELLSELLEMAGKVKR